MSIHTHPELGSEERRRLGRRAQLLAGASVAYNLVEGVIAIAAGVAAGSVALVGFGLDSVVEVSSGLVTSRPDGRASQWSLNHPATVLELLTAAERLLALTGDAVTLCPTSHGPSANHPHAHPHSHEPGERR